jgi:hypothetical protein
MFRVELKFLELLRPSTIDRPGKAHLEKKTKYDNTVTGMKKLLLPKETADLLSISLAQLCRDTNRGLIPFAVLLPGGTRNKTWRPG